MSEEGTHENFKVRYEFTPRKLMKSEHKKYLLLISRIINQKKLMIFSLNFIWKCFGRKFMEKVQFGVFGCEIFEKVFFLEIY